MQDCDNFIAYTQELRQSCAQLSTCHSEKTVILPWYSIFRERMHGIVLICWYTLCQQYSVGKLPHSLSAPPPHALHPHTATSKMVELCSCPSEIIPWYKEFEWPSNIHNTMRFASSWWCFESPIFFVHLLFHKSYITYGNVWLLLLKHIPVYTVQFWLVARQSHIFPCKILNQIRVVDHGHTCISAVIFI